MSKQADEVLKFTKQLVAPEHLSNVKETNNFPNQDLFLKKPEKINSRKRKHQKKKTLSRKELTKLGLFTLPRNSMKYEEVLPLNKLWRGYIREHLFNGQKNIQIPTVESPQYEQFSSLFHKSDFHGASVCVTRSKCPSVVGCSGIIVLDTKGTFKILGKDNKIRTIPKNESVFQISWENVQFTIFGKHLAIRPAERSVKKMKNIMFPDLD